MNYHTLPIKMTNILSLFFVVFIFLSKSLMGYRFSNHRNNRPLLRKLTSLHASSDIDPNPGSPIVDGTSHPPSQSQLTEDYLIGLIINESEKEPVFQEAFKELKTEFLEVLDSQISDSKKRELRSRSYAAQKSSFMQPKSYAVGAPKREYTVQDLSFSDTKSIGYSVWFRALVVIFAFLAFPSLESLIMVFHDDLNTGVVGGAVLPGIGILFGTLISVTYSILLNRQATLQEIATQESSQLSLLTKEISTLFHQEDHRRQVAFQHIWTHAETLINRGRLQELLQIMNSNDPLLNLRDCVTELCSSNFLSKSELYRNRQTEILDIQIPSVMATINKLLTLRSSRLSQESLNLPGIHFSILRLLALWQLVGFSVIVADNYRVGSVFPSVESRLLFCLLVGVFSLSINFAYDLNQPFEGAYQVRRSSISAYLIQVYETIRQSHHTIVS